MSAIEQNFLTPEGKREKERELDFLRSQQLPDLEERLHELSEAGDVSDDSDFEDTKEELFQLRARIRDLEITLENAEIVEHEDSYSRVKFGSSVRVHDEDGNEDVWTIVSPIEANLSLGRISIESPMGAAMVGKRVGETFNVVAPGGELTFEVKEIT